jgi:hypothetical protein
MGKFRVIEEWVNYRVIEVDAASEELAIELALSGEGNEVDGGTDAYEVNAVEMVDGKAVTTLNGGK